jgi:hypothetical protein
LPRRDPVPPVRDTGLVALVLVAVVSALMVFKSMHGSLPIAAPTSAFSISARRVVQDHPAYIPRQGWRLCGACQDGSPGHKITARSAASWIAELSSSARVSATSYSSQDATKMTGPSGGSG